MISTVRARLIASATAFLIGFVVANYGILRVPDRDQWVWLTVAVVLMLTGAVGVVVADTRRRLSLWAVLGLETLVVFTLLPLLWVFTLATTPDTLTARSLLPSDVQWSVFGDVLDVDSFRRAALTSLLVGGIATIVSVLLALPAAHALVRRRVRGGRAVYLVVLAALLAPVVALAGPFGAQLRDVGWFGDRLALVLPTLVLTLPLAIWLSVTAVDMIPWSLRDSVRADGARARQSLRWFVVPHVLPTILAVALIVLVVACNDALIGATLTGSERSRTLPATLLLAADRPDRPTAQVAAVGLLWLVPALLVLVSMPRRMLRLIGRTYS